MVEFLLLLRRLTNGGKIIDIFPDAIWLERVKGIGSDSNNIFLWHESKDMNKKKSLFPKFQLIPISRFQAMHDYVCFIAPIDYCVE